MTTVYKADFKNKTYKQVLDYNKYTWVCSCCNTLHCWDSRNEINKSYTELEVSIETKLVKNRVEGLAKICEDCMVVLCETFKQET